MAKEADRGTFFPVLLFGYLFRGLVTQGLEAGRGLIFPVQNGDGSVDKVTVFCGDIIFSAGSFTISYTSQLSGFYRETGCGG